jgi:uncharacterized integral membrane protein
MQLLLIMGIVFAIGAVTFALQNNIPVTVMLALWRFESSLAVVLLVALALGVLIAGLVSTPSVIKAQWAVSRLRRQVAGLEEEKALLERSVHDLESGAAQRTCTPVAVQKETASYVGLKSLLMTREET